MPHIIVKLIAGRSDQQKSKIAEAITKAVVESAECSEAAISLSVEDIAAGCWAEDVYKPDIIGNWDKLYKKPGYDPV